MNKTTTRHHLTVEKLQSIQEADLPALKTSDYEGWVEAIMFIDNRDDYQVKRLREKAQEDFAKRHPVPAPTSTAIAPPASTPALAPATAPQRPFKNLLGLIEDVAVDVVEESSQRLKTVENRINEAIDSLTERTRELEKRIAAAEKRQTGTDCRYDAQQKHLRNLESRIRGGELERSPREVQQ